MGLVDGALSANDLGGFIGLQRGAANTAVAAMWPTVSLIRDVYTGASSGEVSLTATALWDFAIPRKSNWKKINITA